PERGKIDRAISRHRSDRKRMSSVRAGGRQRAAVTEWSVEERFVSARGALTLVRLRPRTGRTHQLRVHLADLGFPLVGDKTYGRKRGGAGATKAGDPPKFRADAIRGAAARRLCRIVGCAAPGGSRKRRRANAEGLTSGGLKNSIFNKKTLNSILFPTRIRIHQAQ